jgi:hypothetical protein
MRMLVRCAHVPVVRETDVVLCFQRRQCIPCLARVLLVLLLGLSNPAWQSLAAIVAWTGGSGDWGDASHWSSGTVPGPDDNAIIGTANGDITVTISSGTNQIESLVCQVPLQLSGGILGIGATLQASQPIKLTGGTIVGGSIVLTNAAELAVNYGTLDGVTLNGVLAADADGAALTVTNGLVLNGTAFVGPVSRDQFGIGGTINFQGNQVLGGNGTVVFGAVGSYNGLRVPNSGSTLVIGPGITVRGQNGTLGFLRDWGGPSDVSVVNLGTVSADLANGTIAIQAQKFSNQGAVQATNGASLSIQADDFENTRQIQSLGGGSISLVGSNSWNNAGAILVNKSDLIFGGNFTLAELGNVMSTGGNVYLAGTLENTNTTMVLDDKTGTWTLHGGTIQGGTVMTSNGAALAVDFSGGRLDSVTVNGTLAVVGLWSNIATLAVTNGLLLNGTAFVGGTNDVSGIATGALSFEGNQVLGGHGTVIFEEGMIQVANDGSTLIIGSGITVRGGNGSIGAVSTSGSPAANITVVNQGAIVVTNAWLGINCLYNQTTFSTGAFINDGTIAADGATINCEGTFSQADGTLDFGLNPHGDMAVYGTATIGGTLRAHFDGGYIPSAGDTFNVLTYVTNNQVAFAFTNISLPNVAVWQTNFLNVGTSESFLSLTVAGLVPMGVTLSPTNQVVAVGSTVTFNATAIGEGSFSYQWASNGVALASATNSFLVLSNVTKAASGAYTAEAINSGGTLTSDPAYLSVLLPPAISSPPSQTVSIGGLGSFQAEASGDPPLTYQWLQDGTLLPGATNATLILTNVLREQAGGYSVVVANPVGVTTSSPPAVLTIASGLVDCAGAPSGMIAWWRGEENSSDYAATNDALFEGLAGYVPGEVGQAFGLDGVSSYLEAADSDLWNFSTNDFSIDLWANFSRLIPSLMAGDGSIVFIAHDEESGAHNKWLFGLGGEQLYFYVNGAGIGPHFLVQASFTPITNQWYHLAVAKETAVYRLYVNGALASTSTNRASIPDAHAPITIGQAQGFYMAGALDEISLYRRALQGSEIQQIYRQGGQGKCVQAIRLAAALSGGNRVSLEIQGGQAGVTLTVQASPDLEQWRDLGHIVKTHDIESFVDPEPLSDRSRFYRVFLNP